MPAVAAQQDPASVTVDVVTQSEHWSAHPDAEDVVRRAIAKAAAFEGKLGEVAVLLTDDAAIRVMNATWRGIDKPTNVLSFPAAAPAREAGQCGDIAIAFETTAREAREENKSLRDHLSHLCVHGLLHLAGLDHETDADATAMETLETKILATLGIADPYADSADTRAEAAR